MQKKENTYPCDEPFCCSSSGPSAGQRARLTDGQMFVPAGYKPQRDGVELLLLRQPDNMEFGSNG
jgi:hypothetical protein